MIFYHIPKNRCINLDVEELRARGYQLPSQVDFKCALGAAPFFKLVEVSDERDEVFGPVELTKEGKLYIPNGLSFYSQYCVMYDETCVHIALGE